MSKGSFGPPAPLRGPNYEQIEAAVMETARGRWFLAEYARRNRTADTELLLKAIERLQNVIAGQEGRGELDVMRTSLLEIAAAIARLRRDVFSEDRDADGGRGAPQQLDAIVIETEQATHKILRIGERIQEIAWNLREQGVRAAICDALDAGASEIFAACSFQDLTGQKIARVVALMRMIEERLDSLIARNGLDDLVLRDVSAGRAPGTDPSAEAAAEAPGSGDRDSRPASQHEVDALLTPPPDKGRQGAARRVVVDIEDPDLAVREIEADGWPAPGEGAPAAGLPPEEEAGEDGMNGPAASGAGEEEDGDDDLVIFNRLSAELEAAAKPALAPAYEVVAPGDIAFAGEEGETGGGAKPGRNEPEPAIPAGSGGADSPPGPPPVPDWPQAGDPAQTGWDAEFNRLSPAHRMALFS